MTYQWYHGFKLASKIHGPSARSARTEFSVSGSLMGALSSVKSFVENCEFFVESEMRKFWNLLRLEENGSIQWDSSKHRQPIKIYKWLIPSNVRYSNKRINSRLSTENNEFLWRFEIQNSEKISRKIFGKIFREIRNDGKM